MSMTRWHRTTLFIALLFSLANALHFYLDANEKRCFIEELPSDTVVEGKSRSVLPCAFSFVASLTFYFSIGTYRALEWNEKSQLYENRTELGIQVDVVVGVFFSLSP